MKRFFHRISSRYTRLKPGVNEKSLGEHTPLKRGVNEIGPFEDTPLNRHGLSLEARNDQRAVALTPSFSSVTPKPAGQRTVSLTPSFSWVIPKPPEDKNRFNGLREVSATLKRGRMLPFEAFVEWYGLVWREEEENR